MDGLSTLEKHLDEKRWRKAIKTADSILKAGSLRDSDSGRRRFSFMSGDSYTLYILANPDIEISWVKNHASVMFSKAYALMELKDYEKAAEVLLNVLELDPVSPKPRLELCSAYIKLRRFADAAEQLRAAAPNIMSLHDAALLYQKGGFLASQAQEYEHAEALTLYSLLFERREAAFRELEYIRSKTGKVTSDLDEQSPQVFTQAAEYLSVKGEDFTLSRYAGMALKRLLFIYTAGQDEEKAAYYRSRLDGFERVCNILKGE